MKQKQIMRVQSVALILFMLASLIPMFDRHAKAATLTTSADYLSRNKENQTSLVGHEIQLTTATTVSGGTGSNKIILVMPDGDDGTWCATAGTDLITSVASLRNSAIALPGVTLTAKCVKGVGASSYDTITIEGVNNLSAGSLYAVKVSDGATGKLGTPANTTTGIVTLKANNGAIDVDTAFIAIDIIANDQVSVSGNIQPTLSFSIDNTVVGFGSITAAALRYATADANGSASEPAGGDPVTLLLSTNADSGAVIEIKDTNAVVGSGLYNASSATTLTSRASTDVAFGTEGFGVYGKAGSSITLDEAFNNDSNADGAISTSFQTLAATTDPVAEASLDVSLVTAVSGATPAGSYADTLTIVATGKF